MNPPVNQIRRTPLCEQLKAITLEDWIRESGIFDHWCSPWTLPSGTECWLLGVAGWNRYDLQTVDDLIDAIVRDPALQPRIALYDLDALGSGGLPQLQLERPLGTPFLTQVADQRVVQSWWGWDANDRLASLFPRALFDFTARRSRGRTGLAR